MCPIVEFVDKDILTVQSSKVIYGNPSFMFSLYKNLLFQIFHYRVSSLSENHINTVDTWSVLEEVMIFKF